MTKCNISNFVENQFDNYGQFLSKHPWPFIIAPVIVTLLLAFGTFRITINDDLRFLYTQPGSPSIFEYQVHQSFQNLTTDTVTYLNIALVTSDRGNVLQQKYNETFVAINNFIMNNLTINVDGRILNFGDHFCKHFSFCRYSNRPLSMFLDFYFNTKVRKNTQIKLTYPVMNIFGTKVFLPGNLYGVTIGKDGTVSEVILVSMTYRYSKISFRKDTHDLNGAAIQNAIETEVEQFLDTFLVNSGLVHSVYSMNRLKHEIAKNTWNTLIYLPISIILLVVFTIATTCTTDAVTSKPIEGLFGVFTSLLAIISAGGLLFLFGVSYNSTVSVMPFLTLALAVDDTYIILAAWHHTDRNQRYFIVFIHINK